MRENSSPKLIDESPKINFSLTIVKSSPQVSMNDSGFEKLTAAEKLNDSTYRSLVYRTYHNEPTCGCMPTNAERSSTMKIDNPESNQDFLVCPGGCKNRCCSSTRRSHGPSQDNGNDDKVLRFMSSYCVENQRNNTIYNGDYCLEGRMRGGGGEEEEYPMSQHLKQIECSKNSRNVRGKDVTYETFSKYKTVNPVELQMCYGCSRFTDQFSESHGLKNSLNRSPTGQQGPYRKKPYSDITYLTKAFKDAQKFVDSIGKTPGIAGLGLMDPSENPYFRVPREQENIENTNKKNSIQYPVKNSQCEGPCNRLKKSILPWSKATPYTISIPGRDGIIREGVLPKSEIKLDEELPKDVETGPCGEFSCKSKRKKITREISLNVIESAEKISLDLTTKSSRRERKNYRFRSRRGRRLFGGIGNDGLISRRTKRINYVYFSGESYPGSIYGHKNCSNRRKRVPANMGWLWTQYEAVGRLKPRVGWKPGAISRQIRELIREGKAGLLEKNSRPASVTSSEWHKKKLKSRSHVSLKKGQARKLEQKKEELEPPPTLHIQRRDGVYYVTMYPIRQEIMDLPKLSEPIKPLQFKIVKNKDDDSCTSSSTASDIDIEFSPPAAVNRLKKKPNVVHVETQVIEREISGIFRPIEVKNNENKEKKINIKKKIRKNRPLRK